MKNWKRSAMLALALALFVLTHMPATASALPGVGLPSKAAVRSVTLTPKKATVPLGDTLQLTAAVAPASADQQVTYKTSNAAVATVSMEGLVTATGYGKATITAQTANNKRATCAITVPTPVTGVALNKDNALIQKGKSLSPLKATFSPANATDKKLTWQSSNPSVASVNNKGVVKGRAVGMAVISATTHDGGFSAQCQVAVWGKRMRDMSFEFVEGYYALTGSSTQMVVDYDPASYPPLPNYALKWVSSNPSVASVSGEGLVSAHKPGMAVISADSGITATTGRRGKVWAEFVVTDVALQPGPALVPDETVMVIDGKSVRPLMRYNEITSMFPGGKKTNPKKYFGPVYKVGNLTFAFLGGSNPPLYYAQSTASGQVLSRGVGVGSSPMEVLARFGKPRHVTYERLGKDARYPITLTYLCSQNMTYFNFYIDTITQTVFKVDIQGED